MHGTMAALCAAFLIVSPAAAGASPVVAGAPPAAVAASPDTVYVVSLLRAAPGELDALIELVRSRRSVTVAAGLAEPLIFRHSQGDHWDLMLVQPVASLSEHFSDEAERLDDAGRSFGADNAAYERHLRRMAVFREEVYMKGPTRDELSGRAAGAGLIHIEMFVAVPGRYDELVEQREMENAYYHATLREGNLVFTRLAGARWDVMTVGFYDDMVAFATDPDLPDEVFEDAAVNAGFESRGTIGTYLRELLHHHNDTLAVPVP